MTNVPLSLFCSVLPGLRCAFQTFAAFFPKSASERVHFGKNRAFCRWGLFWRRRLDSRLRFANAHPSLASSVGRNAKNMPLACFLNAFPPHRFESFPRKQKTPEGFGRSFFLAEAVGFEPTEPLGSTVFKTAAFDHSATPPHVWAFRACRRSSRRFPRRGNVCIAIARTAKTPLQDTI